MWIKLFQNQGAFLYKRFFFILIISVCSIAVAFGGYVVYQQQVVEQNIMDSISFFEQYKTDILQYKEKRRFYLEKYGQPTKSEEDKKNNQMIDTYLSKDGSKGITLMYRVDEDNKDEAYIIGYLVIGQQKQYDTSQLKNVTGQTLQQVIAQFGSGEALSEVKDEETLELSFQREKNGYILTIDLHTKLITVIKKIENN